MRGEGNTGRAGRRGAAAFADPIVLSLLFILLITAIFLAFPAIDLWMSGLFYDQGDGFFLIGTRALTAFRRSGELVVTVVVVGLLASVAFKLADPARTSLVPPNVVLFLLSTLAVGPGLIVNLLLKDHWGRPRPIEVEAFGGADPYVPVWQITDYCVGNCSFVAGEASSAIWLTALALVVPKEWRVPAAVVTFAYAALLSLTRIALGGHFLSDTLLAWGLTWLVIAVGYRALVERPPPSLRPAALEAGLTRLGLMLRGRRGTER